MLFLEMKNLADHFGRYDAKPLTATYGDPGTTHYEVLLVVGVEGENIVYSHPTGNPFQFLLAEVAQKDVDRGHPRPTHVRLQGVGGETVDIPLRNLGVSDDTDHAKYKLNYDMWRRSGISAVSPTDAKRIQRMEAALAPILGGNAAFMASRNVELSDLTPTDVQRTIDALTALRDGLSPTESLDQ